MDIKPSEWPVGNVSSLEAMEFLIMKPTPERRLSADGLPNRYREHGLDQQRLIWYVFRQ